MIVVVGLSHKTAPIEVREKAALDDAAVAELLQEVVADGPAGEAMIVSTCNRVEIVAAGRGVETPDLEALADFVEGKLVGRVPEIRGHVYRRLGNAASEHLFRVAASLDSLVMGEPQILGQVKGAFDKASGLGTIGRSLRRVVGHALRTAKRVRTETTIGAGQVSVPTVAVDLARQIFGELKGRQVALVGSGAMGQSAAKLLSAAGAKLSVIGRNQEKVAALAAQLGGQPRALDDLQSALVEVDVLVSTTSAPHFVVTREAVKAVRRKRRGRPLFLIDLAVPRDIDPRTDDLDSVFLYNVDNLSQIVAETLSSRQKEAERGEEIVTQETRAYERARNAEQVTPTIVALRQSFGRVLQEELQRSTRSRLKHLGAAEREAMEKMHDAALKKMLHPATARLRALAAGDDSQAEVDQYVAVLRELFELSPLDTLRKGEGRSAETQSTKAENESGVGSAQKKLGGSTE